MDEYHRRNIRWAVYWLALGIFLAVLVPILGTDNSNVYTRQINITDVQTIERVNYYTSSEGLLVRFQEAENVRGNTTVVCKGQDTVCHLGLDYYSSSHLLGYGVSGILLLWGVFSLLMATKDIRDEKKYFSSKSEHVST